MMEAALIDGRVSIWRRFQSIRWINSSTLHCSIESWFLFRRHFLSLSWKILEDFWRFLEILGDFFEEFWRILEILGGFFGDFRRFLEIFWKILEYFGDFWRFFWRFVEIFLKNFGDSWIFFWRFFEIFWRILEIFGDSWRFFWRILEILVDWDSEFDPVLSLRPPPVYPLLPPLTWLPKSPVVYFFIGAR